MVDELQMAVRETMSPVIPSSMEIEETVVPVPMQCDPAFVGEVYYPQDAVLDSERAGRLVDEVIALVKDDRMNTKKAISADIESTAKVQEQNNRVIEACERELRRRDLTDEQRMDILKRMEKAAESTVNVSEASRKFQQEQLERSHKLPLSLLVGATICVLFGIGGRALFTQ